MGKSHGKWFVPPKQYTMIQKLFPTLEKGWPIKHMWYSIMQSTEGDFLYPYKLKLAVKNPKKTPRQNPGPFPYIPPQNVQQQIPRQNPKAKGKFKKSANMTKSKFPPQPTYVPPFGGYSNPRPSTSTWPLETSPAVGSRDPLQLGCQIPERYYQQNSILSTYEVDTSSNDGGSYYSPIVGRSDYSPETTSGSIYSPRTEPISPYSSGAETSDALLLCMRKAKIDSPSNTEQMVMQIVTAPKNPIAPKPVARVGPMPLALEPVAPVVSPSQGVYPDPEIEGNIQVPPSPSVELPEIEVLLDEPPEVEEVGGRWTYGGRGRFDMT